MAEREHATRVQPLRDELAVPAKASTTARGLSRVALPDDVRLTFAQVSLLQSARRLRAMNAEGEVVALRR